MEFFFRAGRNIVIEANAVAVNSGGFDRSVCLLMFASENTNSMILLILYLKSRPVLFEIYSRWLSSDDMVFKEN